MASIEISRIYPADVLLFFSYSCFFCFAWPQVVLPSSIYSISCMLFSLFKSFILHYIFYLSVLEFLHVFCRRECVNMSVLWMELLNSEYIEVPALNDQC